MKPTILVTSAAGHTGAAVVEKLREQDHSVRALVRRRDARSERLQRLGAEVIVGNLYDWRDLRGALSGVERAYHCAPFAPYMLHGSMLFALAAEAAQLEVVVWMSAWNPHAVHPAIHQREHWLANNLHGWMPTVRSIHVNPGLFAFTYFFGLQAAVHFGELMLPYGEGENAPPSNEDIAAVVAALLADPEPHIGRKYRPTGPRLITGHDAAEILGRVLGRRVRYRDVSTRMFVKAGLALGLSRFEVSQIRYYAEELRGGTYAIGAPSDHVEVVTGRPPEDFEATARRYVAQPDLVMQGLRVGTKLDAVRQMIRTVRTRVPDLDAWVEESGHPSIGAPQLAHENPDWREVAHQRRLLLPDRAPTGQALTL